MLRKIIKKPRNFLQLLPIREMRDIGHAKGELMGEIKKCLTGVQSKTYDALPDAFNYPLPANGNNKDDTAPKLSTTKPLSTNVMDALPSILSDDICYTDKKGASKFLMRRDAIPMLVKYLSPENDPILFSAYTENRGAYPSFVSYIEQQLLSGERGMEHYLQFPPQQIDLSPDTTQWTRPTTMQLGIEEIAFIRTFLSDDIGDNSYIRMVKDPFNSDAKAQRFAVSFSNRLDETDYENIIAAFQQLISSEAAPVRLRIRAETLMQELEAIKKEVIHRIAQAKPIRTGREIFKLYPDPEKAENTYHQMLSNPPPAVSEISTMFTAVKEVMFPHEVALIRMHLGDKDNELFVERYNGENTADKKLPRRYAIRFFADFLEIDLLLSDIAATNPSLSSGERERIANLKMEMSRLQKQKSEWYDKTIKEPAYVLGGATIAAYLFNKFARHGGGGGGPTFVELPQPGSREQPFEPIDNNDLGYIGLTTFLGIGLIKIAKLAVELAAIGGATAMGLFITNPEIPNQSSDMEIY